MNLMLDDTRKMAVVYDFDRVDWYMYSGQIPDDYGIELNPAVSADDWVMIAGNRVLNYEERVGYAMVPFGTGFSAEPRHVFIQQLILPTQIDTA